jgi:ribosomal protein S12 methylthiotransferase
MGCSKNRVDSEHLLRVLQQRGCTLVPETADLADGGVDEVIINTCGFIQDAKEESVAAILEAAEAKKAGLIEKLSVFGCLSQRYTQELRAEIPEVDQWEGVLTFDTLGRVLTTPSHYAYLKIAEGCDRHCAYCAIPIITGKHRSRPIQEILDEVRYLVSQGTKEFQVIAQELTYYGVDIDGKQHIAELIEQIAAIEGVEWIRLHYAYPAHFPWDLLRVMREHDNVCNYLDIALQHISNNMLSRMQRHVTKEETYDLIRRMRHEVPGIHIRTTLMVGFPGETDEDFQELIEFVKWARFERMGAFAYSEEDGTYSAIHYQDDVPVEVKQQRLDKLMRIQQNISAEIEQAKVGQILRVIIDREEGDYWIGRTEFCSPEVDPEVLISKSEHLKIGAFYNARITDAEEFDLYATTRYE